MSRLFMLTGTDPESYEMDRTLLVVADSPTEAYELWRDCFWQEDAAEFATFTGPVLDEPPEEGDHMVIWSVTIDLATKGAIDWHSDGCKAVGYLAEANI